MLKFTRKTEYALMAIKYMETKPVHSITTAKEISNNIDIPYQNLSKILQSLAKKKFIQPIYGPNGGYKIQVKLNQLNLWDFLEKMEGPLGISDCLINIDCNQIEKCNIKTPINMIQTKIKTVFSKMTIGDIIKV